MKNNLWLKVFFCSVLIFSACSTCAATTVSVGGRNRPIMLVYANGQNAGIGVVDDYGNVEVPCGQSVGGPTQ